jgi:soluble lytic murein transglycosylase-like protein
MALTLPIMRHLLPRILHHVLIVMTVLALFNTAMAAAIYKFRDRRGVINYTNILPKGITPQIVMVYCPACDPTSKVDFSHVSLKTTDFGPHIRGAIAKNPVDEALVRAIIQAESAYNPYALSKSGAQGLMQLMPATAAQYGVSDSYDAQQNINGGVAYLRFLLDMFDGDVRLVSAAYNAGENNVLKYAGVPPFAETQVYVQRVGQLYLRYRNEIAARDAKPVLAPAPIAALAKTNTATNPGSKAVAVPASTVAASLLNTASGNK